MATTSSHDPLRVEVRRLKTRSGRTRTLPRLLHVGAPGGDRLVVPLDAVTPPRRPTPWRGDDGRGLATDVLTRALSRLGRPQDQQVWVTRGGELVAGDGDWRWCAATRAARARYGLAGGCFYVVTRHGWLELHSGERRSWLRMRATWQPPDVGAGVEPTVDPVAPCVVEGWPISR